MFNVLNDLRVVEMAAFVAGPLAGMTLAQLGARVIRVDDVGGNADIGRWPIAANGKSLYWAGLNKAKQSLCVDLGDERGQALVADLICDDAPGAGILITNFPMKGWLAYEKLAARRPDLIVVQITGDWQGRTALDYTVNAGAGFPFITGDGGPTHPVNNVTPGWDLMCGSHVAIAVLAAERRRRDTGKGSHVRVALQDMGLATIGSLGYIAEVQVNDQDRQGYGNHIFGSFGNDFGTQRGLILSPELFNRFVLPSMDRLIGVAKRHGKRVLLHSCGSIRRVIPTLIDHGVDALHPLQALATDMQADLLAREFGAHVAFVGGVDTQDLLVKGTPAQIRDEVLRLREAFGPNYVVSPSHEALLPNVPIENVAAMSAAARE
jgi:2-methylfumaryl-CoA isomerase